MIVYYFILGFPLINYVPNFMKCNITAGGVGQVRGGDGMLRPSRTGTILLDHAVQGGVLIDCLGIGTAVTVVSAGNGVLERTGVKISGCGDMGEPAFSCTAEAVIFLQGDKVGTARGDTFLDILRRTAQTVKVLDVVYVLRARLVEHRARKDIVLVVVL